MVNSTLKDYQDNFQRLTQEIQYVDQQRASLVEQALKMQGAIEALKTLEPETDGEASE